MTTTPDELAAVAAAQQQPSRIYSFDEYLAWAGEHQFVEWVDGEVVAMSPTSLAHQELVGFLFFVLKAYVEQRNLGRVLTAPFAMKLTAARRGREPDILFVARAREHLLKPTHLDGPADVIVEIVSPESTGRDRGEKFVEYEAAGVQEYWLIDPERQQAEFYQLGTDGHYRLAALTADGRFVSPIINGFWLRVEWLWQLPDVLGVLHELSII
jgi:Uma2 family endonuclease